jgi:hypothetical protein
MGFMSKFENKMEDTIEGAADSLVKAPLSPVQIAKKAEKQMRRGKIVGKGKQYAPTLYTVLVNEDDDARLFGYYPTIAGETETYLAARAAEEGLVMDGSPLVRFMVTPGLRHGKFDVVAEAVAAPLIAQLRNEEMERYGIGGNANVNYGANGYSGGYGDGAGAYNAGAYADGAYGDSAYGADGYSSDAYGSDYNAGGYDANAYGADAYGTDANYGAGYGADYNADAYGADPYSAGANYNDAAYDAGANYGAEYADNYNAAPIPNNADYGAADTYGNQDAFAYPIDNFDAVKDFDKEIDFDEPGNSFKIPAAQDIFEMYDYDPQAAYRDESPIQPVQTNVDNQQGQAQQSAQGAQKPPLPYVPEDEIDYSIDYGEYTFNSQDFQDYRQNGPALTPLSAAQGAQVAGVAGGTNMAASAAGAAAGVAAGAGAGMANAAAGAAAAAGARGAAASAAQAPNTVVFAAGTAGAQRPAQTPNQTIVRARLVDTTNRRTYNLATARLIIGREHTCDIALPDINASRSHAELKYEPQGVWRITDLGSTNGTRVNGREITSHTLRPGERITIGMTNLVFELA